MNVTISRSELECLLVYAEAEVETRCGCLKDAGPDQDELQGEINEANDLFAAIRKSMAEQRHQPATSIRYPTLEIGDKIGQLRDAVRGDRVLKEDTVLTTTLNGIQEGHRLLVAHLNANYRWD